MCVCVQGCEEKYLMVIVSVLFLILCLTFEVSVRVTLCLLYKTVLFDDHRVQTDWDGIVFTSTVNTT